MWSIGNQAAENHRTDFEKSRCQAFKNLLICISSQNSIIFIWNINLNSSIEMTAAFLLTKGKTSFFLSHGVPFSSPCIACRKWRVMMSRAEESLCHPYTCLIAGLDVGSWSGLIFLPVSKGCSSVCEFKAVAEKSNLSPHSCSVSSLLSSLDTVREFLSPSSWILVWLFLQLLCNDSVVFSSWKSMCFTPGSISRITSLLISSHSFSLLDFGPKLSL